MINTSNNISILNFLCSDYSKFFYAEKKIANYILENKDTVVKMTVSELAKASDTSDATVTRFCKRLGTSYREFRLLLAKDIMEEQQQSISRTISNDINMRDINQSLQNILANKIAELTSTVSMIDSDNLRIIIRLLQSADIVQIAAVGNTIPVAMDAAFKFNQLGIRTVTSEISEKQHAFALCLTKKDVLIIISNSGKSRRMQQIASAAKNNNATILVITNDKESPLGLLANYKLITATREKLLTGNFSFSRVSSVTIIEILYLFLFIAIKDADLNILRHEDFIRSDKE